MKVTPFQKAPLGHQKPTAELMNGLPLQFEPNVGQTNPAYPFIAHGEGFDAFLNSTGIVVDFHPSSGGASPATPPAVSGHSSAPAAPPTIGQVPLGITSVGASTSSTASFADPLPGKVNYFLGKSPTSWYRDIPTYGEVIFHNVYPGVDLEYFGTAQGFEYDYVVQPGADPSPITIGYVGGVHLLDRYQYFLISG